METAERRRFIYTFGKFALDPQEKTLSADGAPVHLTAKEFETLLLLVENSGRALSKEEMMRAVWADAFVEEGNLAKQISRLRKTLKAAGGDPIETLPKHGYRFAAEVSRVFPAPDEAASGTRAAARREAEPAETAARRRFRLRAVAAAVLGPAIAATILFFWYWRDARAPAKIDSMAILPLLALDGDENSKALGLGLADTLIMKIGGLKQTTVRPIGAVVSYAGEPQDSLAIGRRLNVDAVLEGTIRHADGRVRVNVRLLRVATGEQLWAENFEDRAAAVFELEERLSERTARALKLKLDARAGEEIAKRFTGDAAALDAYQKGRYFWNRRTENDLRRAIEHFGEAIRRDPDYALAYAGLADAYSLLADYSGAPPDQTYPKAKEAALRALALDDGLAAAHASLAYVKMSYDWDWQGAENEYRRAIALNPSYATARQWYAEYLTAMGRFDEALAEIQRAKEIDPLSPIVNAGEVWVLYFARRYDEAIERGRAVAALDPDFAEIHEYLKRCYDQKEMYREAISARQTRRRLVGLEAAESEVLKAAAAAGSPGQYWQKRLEQEFVEARGEPPQPFNMAEIYARLGAREAAFDSLEEAVVNRDYEVIYLRVAPNLDPLRADDRFAALLRRLNL